jgi:hypothetical protein
MDYPGLLALLVQKYAKVRARNVVLERAYPGLLALLVQKCNLLVQRYLLY